MTQLNTPVRRSVGPQPGARLLVAILAGLGGSALLVPSSGCDGGCVPVVDGPDGPPDSDAGNPPTECSLAGVAWEPIPAPPTTSSPYQPRAGHVMHWSGSRVVVWGGATEGGITDTGFFYDPATQTYTAIAPAPTSLGGRWDFDDSNTGLNPYTGLMLVWGGRSTPDGAPQEVYPSTGALLDVVNNIWYEVLDDDSRVPRPRKYTHLVPRGDRWIVWGGQNDGGETASSPQSGGRVLTTHYYDSNGVPQNLGTDYDDCWSSMGSATDTCPPTVVDLPNELSSRKHGVVVWLGDRMVAWGGSFEHMSFPNDGAIYDYRTATWTSMNPVGAPVGREYAPSAASPDSVYLFGGADDDFQVSQNVVRGDGAIYHLDTNSWEPLPTANAPSPRIGRGFWILDRYFFVPQGGDLDTSVTPPRLVINEDAALYDSHTGEWLRFNPGNSHLVQRFQPNVVWTGDRLVMWGGRSLADGSFMTSGLELVLPSCL